MNTGAVLAVTAGVAIAVQVVANTVGMRSLGLAALIGLSGLVTAAAGLAVALFFARPELAGKAILCAVASGLLGAFILASVVLAAQGLGLARTLSLVIGAQLLFGIVIDRSGILGPAGQDLGLAKIAGIALVLAGGILLVRE